MNQRQSVTAESQPAERVQSDDGAFHHPSGHAQMAAINSSTPDDPVSNVSTLQGLTVLVTVVPAIGPHTLGVVNQSSAWARNGVIELRHILAIGPGPDDIDLDALRIDGEVVFAACIAGDRLGSVQFPSRTARTAKFSAITRDNSSLSAPRRRAKSARCSVVHMPACCHARSWRQQVMHEPQPIF